MENDKSKMLVTFIAGAAVGAAIGYLLASGKKDEWVKEFKDLAGKIKDDIKGKMDDGKQAIKDIDKELTDMMGV